MSEQDDKATPEERARRLAWFQQYCDRLDAQPPDLPLRCPCCGCKTLDERGGYDICPVCFWEDDGQDDHDADVVRGGPNGSLSLTQARENYKRIGASEERRLELVRPPRPEEQPEGGVVSEARSRPVATFTRPDGQRRVEVFERSDGTFGFEEWQFGAEEQAWFPCGLYSRAFLDSAEAALREARARVRWLADLEE